MLPNWWHCLLYIHTLGQLTLNKSFFWRLSKNPLLNTCYKSHKNPILARENKSSTHSSTIWQTVTTAWPSTSGIRNCRAKQGESQTKSQCRFTAVQSFIFLTVSNHILSFTFKERLTWSFCCLFFIWVFVVCGLVFFTEGFWTLTYSSHKSHVTRFSK